MAKSKLQKKSFTHDIKSFLFTNLFHYKSMRYEITHQDFLLQVLRPGKNGYFSGNQVLNY